MKKSWTIELEDGQHVLEFEQGMLVSSYQGMI